MDGDVGGVRSEFKFFVIVKIIIGICFGHLGLGGVHKLVCFGMVKVDTSNVVVKVKNVYVMVLTLTLVVVSMSVIVGNHNIGKLPN